MFSGAQQSGVSDLLLGAGSLNGFGSDTGAPSSSGAPGGTPSGSTAFDLNDFPSLGGGNGGGSSGNSGNGLSAALQQQQQILAHQQMLQGGGAKQSNNLYRLAMGGANGATNFNMATEDFPALPGAPPAGGGNRGSSGTGPTSSPLLMGTSRGPISNSGALYGNEIGGGAPSAGGSQLEGPGLLVGGGLLGLPQTGGGQSSQLRGGATSTATPGGAGSAMGTALSGDYGLLGLLGVIRMTDADRNALALGSDLTMLGLNLGSSEQIYSTFTGPWSDSTGPTKEPHFQVCYDKVILSQIAFWN